MSTLGTNTASPPPSLHDLLWQRWCSLLDIKRRLHALRPFVSELERVTRGKRFRIRNDIVWHQILDSRDKLIIDLCSLSVEMRHGIKPKDSKARESHGFLGKKGLFRQIRDNYTASFSRTYARHPDDDDWEAANSIESKARLFVQLFPGCAGDSPTGSDIEDLCERFRLQAVPLRNDRNKNRAHILEGELGQARMLSMDDVAELFTYCEELLDGLSVLSSRSTLCGGNMNHADCDETAADQVDMVLLGNIGDVRRLTDGRSRDELYPRLHEIDDQEATDDSEREPLHFNDRQFSPLFDGFLRTVGPSTSA